MMKNKWILGMAAWVVATLFVAVAAPMLLPGVDPREVGHVWMRWSLLILAVGAVISGTIRQRRARMELGARGSVGAN